MFMIKYNTKIYYNSNLQGREVKKMKDKREVKASENLIKGGSKMKNTKLLGQVGVDSGQLLITDPCYLENEIPNYKTLCEISGQINYKWGHAGAGFKLDGFGGDGLFPVYGVYEDGMLVEMRVVFKK